MRMFGRLGIDTSFAEVGSIFFFIIYFCTDKISHPQVIIVVSASRHHGEQI